MPLLDHFHPPLSQRRHWEAFHASWATIIAMSLNENLPDEYFAESQVHHGPRIEIDVATWSENDTPEPNGGVATLTKRKTKLSPPDLSIPMTFPPSFGIHVMETSGGPTLVAAIELVSPANKDRPESRKAFAAKCHAYLQAGCGLIVVDMVTNRNSRPFDELLVELLAEPPQSQFGPLTAVSYRPLRDGECDSLEIRAKTLSIGMPLPALPLSLNAGIWIDVDLNETYQETCSRSRL
jgi:hypothetical protein